MGYNEFLELAKADAERSRAGYLPFEIEDSNPDSFIVTWRIAGQYVDASGPVQAREPQPEPELEPLLELLDDLGLRRRQVNEVKALMHRGEIHEYDDHNGSWTQIGYKAITVDRLHTQLAAYGVVEPKPAGPRP